MGIAHRRSAAMSEKTVAIVGAGIAGLSAGCYGQICGYRTKIFEKNENSGGLCTSWERNSYTINGCVSFLIGSGPGTIFHEVWRELGALRNVAIVDYDYFIVVEGADGRELLVHSNIDKFEQHLLEISPEDQGQIQKLLQGARTGTRYDLPMGKAPELQGPLDKMKMLFTIFPLIKAMGRWKKISIQEFASQLKSSMLRETLPALNTIYASIPVFMRQLAFAWSHMRTAGYPIGGSLALSERIAARYKELGGDLHLGKAVTRIVIEHDRAIGVQLADGTVQRADYVISGADGYSTIFDMLGGKYVDQTVRNNYETLPTFCPIISVALGVRRTFPDFPLSACGKIYILKEPEIIAGYKVDRLQLFLYNFDPTLAPEGKTLLKVQMPASYQHWKSIVCDRGRYEAEKEAVASKVIAFLEQRFNGITEQVEMQDVATPTTFERYAGVWKGSHLGWDCTPETIFKPISKTLPGLDGFYMTGQWVEIGGGLPVSAISGRNVIQLLCKREGRTFVTHKQ